MEGWVKTHRSIQQHYLWQDKPFSKGQAWIDIILMANHKDTKFMLGHELLDVERGSFITSEVKLMERWGWSKSKVRNFLTMLQKDSMIVKKTDRKKTTLKVLNYEVWQKSETTKEPVSDHNPTTKEPVSDTNKNDNNVNNDDNEKKKDNVPYQEVKDLFAFYCKELPQIKILTDARKKRIKKIYLNEAERNVIFFKELFEKVGQSNFLNGDNDKNWSATFDWVLKPSKMTNILEGNYDNKIKEDPLTKLMREEGML